MSRTTLPNSTPLAQRLSKNLARRRKALQLTQAQVAEMLRMEPETVSRIERGRYLPPLRTLEQLASILRTSIVSLIGSQISPKASGNVLVSRWLSGLSQDDRRFVLDQAKRQATHLRQRKLRRSRAQD